MLKTGQTHTQKYMSKLLDMVVEGKIDPTLVISHGCGSKRGEGYKLFKNQQDEGTQVVLRPA